jgi:hypothetical protein
LQKSTAGPQRADATTRSCYYWSPMCLRGREIAAFTLDHIDWKRERLAIPERKAGHSRTFPFSGVVGEAVLD